MICPNCGASNSTRATFCRRCHQRLPVAGLAAGVTYPRRRNVAGGGGRLPIIAALFLALAGLVVGALLVGLAGRPGPTLIANATGTPVSSLPIFVQPTASPSPATPTPPQSFPSLPTPPPSVLPTDTPLFTPPPSESPTPTPTATPTKKPTPPPTPTPVALTCAHATGTPTGQAVIGFGNKTPKSSKGWCIDEVDFQFVTGSSYGTVNFLFNGKNFGSYTCAFPTPCPDPHVELFPQPKLAKVGASLDESTSCEQVTGNDCTAPDAVKATITIKYELATP